MYPDDSHLDTPDRPSLCIHLNIFAKEKILPRKIIPYEILNFLKKSEKLKKSENFQHKQKSRELLINYERRKGRDKQVTVHLPENLFTFSGLFLLLQAVLSILESSC